MFFTVFIFRLICHLAVHFIVALCSVQLRVGLIFGHKPTSLGIAGPFTTVKMFPYLRKMSSITVGMRPPKMCMTEYDHHSNSNLWMCDHSGK